MTYSLTVDVTITWIAVVIYVVATILNTWGVIFKHERVERVSYWVVSTGVLVHGLALLYRWVGSGHGPYIVRYEVLSANAWVLLALFLTFSRIFKIIRPASVIVFPSGFLLVALGMFYNPEVRKLPPSLRSIWLTLHVSFYKIAFATALMALAFSILYLLRQRSKATWLDRIPPSATLDIVAYRFAGFAFTFWAIGMLAGSIWAYYSWGSFWSWDPIETWSLVTWIVMGVYLHLRRFFGWKGARAAYLYCVCFGFAVATVFFASLIEVTLHGQYFR